MRVTQRFNTVLVRLCTEALRLLTFPLRCDYGHATVRLNTHLHTAKHQYHFTYHSFIYFIINYVVVLGIIQICTALRYKLAFMATW